VGLRFVCPTLPLSEFRQNIFSGPNVAGFFNKFARRKGLILGTP
jgi:hypothetical protein